MTSSRCLAAGMRARIAYLLVPMLSLAASSKAAADSCEISAGCGDAALQVEIQIGKVERLRKELQAAEAALHGLRVQVESCRDISCEDGSVVDATFLQLKADSPSISGQAFPADESRKLVESDHVDFHHAQVLPAGKNEQLQPSFRTKASSAQLTEACQRHYDIDDLCAAMTGEGVYLRMDSEKRIKIEDVDRRELYCDQGGYVFQYLEVQRYDDYWIVERLGTLTGQYSDDFGCM